MPKVGFSLSRCIVDILEGRVKLEDVERIEARTRFDPENKVHRDEIWYGYTEWNYWSNPVWMPYKDRREEIEGIYLQLYRTNRLVQPRLQGQWPEFANVIWKEV